MPPFPPLPNLDRGRRRRLLQALALAPAGGLAALPMVLHAQAGGWSEAWSQVDAAHAMAGRVSTTLQGLSETVERLLARRQELTEQLARWGAELPELRRRQEGLLEEFRNGLFCSGCGKTRSQILAKGETFPHPGQSILRPTPQQLRDKEAELLRPVGELGGRLDRGRGELPGVEGRARAGVDQVVFGLSLWRCAMAHWSGQLNRGLAARQRQQQAELAALRDALERSQGRAAAGQDAAARAAQQADAQILQRQLDRKQQEIDEFAAQGQRLLARLVDTRRQQKAAIEAHLDKRLLRQATPAVSDGAVSPLASQHELGVYYLMGSLGDAAGNAILADVQAFVTRFKAGEGGLDAGGPSPAPSPGRGPAAGGGPPPAAPAKGLADLLQKLP